MSDSTNVLLKIPLSNWTKIPGDSRALLHIAALRAFSVHSNLAPLLGSLLYFVFRTVVPSPKQSSTISYEAFLLPLSALAGPFLSIAPIFFSINVVHFILRKSACEQSFMVRFLFTGAENPTIVSNSFQIVFSFFSLIIRLIVSYLPYPIPSHPAESH